MPTTPLDMTVDVPLSRHANECIHVWKSMLAYISMRATHESTAALRPLDQQPFRRVELKRLHVAFS